MTKQEFDSTKWGAGMRVRYTCGRLIGEDLADFDVKDFDIVSVNFDNRLIGVRDGDTEECPNCGGEIEILTWLNYENCDIINS